MLEGQKSPVKHKHLDRCLVVRVAETTCPSGVPNIIVSEIGRAEIEQRAREHGYREACVMDSKQV